MDEIACLKDIEDVAIKVLQPASLDFFRSGADQMQTLHENKSAFQKYRLLPRMLIDVSHRDLSTTVLGHHVEIPIGISPTGMHKMAHVDGECGSAKAAKDAGTIFILSTMSSTSLEEVASTVPDSIKWFQLYIFKDREVTKKLVGRAEAAGFSALVLTVDTQSLGKRRNDERRKFSFPPHLGLENIVTLLKAGHSENEDDGQTLKQFVMGMFDKTLSWKDIDWLRTITKLPIVVKGILHPDDARLAAEYGASAVMVSNHGGRQLDGVPATIDCLQEIVAALNGTDCEVYLDGGVTMGTDVLKALALGAKMVFIGRPVLWGLAYNGQAGVKKTLDLLRHELELSMALSGCTSVENIEKQLVLVPKSKY